MAAFIRKKGVTVCPSFGTAAFREMNIEREKTRAEEARQNSGRWLRSRKAKLERAARK